MRTATTRTAGTQSAARLMLYAVISSVETDLRVFISEHTPAEDPLKFLGPDLHATCLERAAKEEDILSPTTVEGLIAYADFSDHYRLVNTHRHLFPSAIASHIRDITHKLEQLVPIRNRVMHSRPLQGSDLPTTLAVAEGLAKARVGPWTQVRKTLDLLAADPSFVYRLRIPVLPEAEERIAHNLPTPDFDETGFVGRQDFVELTIGAILGSYPVITVLGEGGIGKSALALKVAYELLDRQDCPFDLIIWSSSKTHTLTGTEIREITDSIASSLDLIRDISDSIGGGLAEDPLEGLLDDLRAVPTLLILDNLETVLDEKIKSFLARLPPGSKILVTSRIGIGAYEHPLRLDAMKEDDTIVFMRTLARVRQVSGLVKCSNRQLLQYTGQLYNNPGFIKWFVAGVQAGTRPEELLVKPDAFLDFCLSNVYEYLSADAKTTLRSLLLNPGASQGDVGYYSGLDGPRLTQALNNLYSTNMVNMLFVPEGSSYDSYYEVTELAGRYLSRHHPLSPEEVQSIEERRKKMVAMQEELRAVGRRNPYQRGAICVRDRRDWVAAMGLKRALEASRTGRHENALELIVEAKRLTPEYFEVYRVEGIVLWDAGRFVEAAGAFQRAMELNPDWGPTLYSYSLFLMKGQDDVEGAEEYARRAHEVDPGRVAVMMHLVRARVYSSDFVGAREVLRVLEEGRERLGVMEARKCVDLHLQTFLREGDVAVHAGELPEALVAFENGREYWITIPAALVDSRLRHRMGKAILSATWMVRRMLRGETYGIDLVERAQRVVSWLNEGAAGREWTRKDRSGSDMLYGKVARLPVGERYGFLECDDGTEVFFHMQSVGRSAWEGLSIGAGLSFRVDRDESGRTHATDVMVVHPGHLVREDVGRELVGIVKTLFTNRGFGYVRAYDGPIYYFHRSFVNDWDRLEEGTRVTFVVGTSPADADVCARRVRIQVE